jgi:general secretion pathway protein J
MNRPPARGFTLIELLTALLLMGLLAVMSQRGLSAVLDAREHVQVETDKWRSIDAFFARFQSDLQLAAPRPVRQGAGVAPPWVARVNGVAGAALEFTRFAAAEGVDAPRRVGYRFDDGRHEVELLLWPALDNASEAVPARYAILSGVSQLELHYLTPALAWVNSWPAGNIDAPLPRAVRLTITLESSEQIVRVFEVSS